MDCDKCGAVMMAVGGLVDGNSNFTCGACGHHVIDVTPRKEKDYGWVEIDETKDHPDNEVQKDLGLDIQWHVPEPTKLDPDDPLNHTLDALKHMVGNKHFNGGIDIKFKMGDHDKFWKGE